MYIDIVLRTTFPIFFLIGIGLLSKKTKVLKNGDERVLNAYLYYFALPALFIVDLSEKIFTVENIKFILVGIIPIFIVLMVCIILFLVFRSAKNTIYLLVLSTIFGSTAFFGIPFITFAFPGQESRSLATLSAITINLVSVTIS
ncbi:MAG: AEC family transporter, partial [Candidatus Bathyarchaeia archaeon]